VWVPENFGTTLKFQRREQVDPQEHMGECVANASPALFTAALSGAQTWQLFGHKVASVDAIPEPLRDRLERDHPDWLRNPGIWRVREAPAQLAVRRGRGRDAVHRALPATLGALLGMAGVVTAGAQPGVIAMQRADASATALADIESLRRRVRGFDVVRIPTGTGRVELQASAALTVERLRDVVLDAAPPRARPAPPAPPHRRDDLPAGVTAPYVAERIAPFAFHRFSNVLNYGGWHTNDLVAYGATHGFGTVYPYLDAPAARPELPQGTRFMTWVVVNWGAELLPRMGLPAGRWDLLAGRSLDQGLADIRWPPVPSDGFEQLMLDMEDVIVAPAALRLQPWYPRTADAEARRRFERDYYDGYVRTRAATIEAARRRGFRRIGIYGDDVVKPAWFALLAGEAADDGHWDAYQSRIVELVDIVHANLYFYFWSPRNVAFALTVLDLERRRLSALAARKPSQPYFWTLMHGGSDAPWIWNRERPIPTEDARAVTLLALMSGVQGITQWNWSDTGSHVSVPRPVVGADLQLGSALEARRVDGRGSRRFGRYDALHVVDVADPEVRFRAIDPASTAPPWGAGEDRPVYAASTRELTRALRTRAEPIAGVVEGLALARAVESLLADGTPANDPRETRRAFVAAGVVHRLVRSGRWYVLATYDPAVLHGGRPRRVELRDFAGILGLLLRAPADSNVRLWIIEAPPASPRPAAPLPLQ
jgi:hypothetical protein